MIQQIFIAAIIFLYGFSLYITRKEKRSAGSWISERLLFLRIRKGIFISTDKPDEYLVERAMVNDMPYQLPIGLNLVCKVERVEFAEMDCVVLGVGKSGRCILYLHGGAYVDQPVLAHWTFLDKLVKHTQARVIVPIYPKAPVHHYGETFEGLCKIYKSLLETVAPGEIVVMGDSAGGGIALAFAQTLLQEKLPQPKNIILLSPWLDISMDNPHIGALERKDPMLRTEYLKAMGKAWAGTDDVHGYQVSPIYGPLEGLGRISLFVGTHEIFLADALKLKARARQKAVGLDYHEYPKMNHVFPLFPIPEAKRALKEIVAIINR